MSLLWLQTHGARAGLIRTLNKGRLHARHAIKVAPHRHNIGEHFHFVSFSCFFFQPFFLNFDKGPRKKKENISDLSSKHHGVAMMSRGRDEQKGQNTDKDDTEESIRRGDTLKQAAGRSCF